MGTREKLREKINRELKSGLYTLLILKSVDELEEAYGYQIIKHIEEKTKGDVKLKEATVYPVLRYMDKHKILQSFWASSELGAPRKYYRLTDEGKKLLDTLIQDYTHLRRISNGILKSGKMEILDLEKENGGDDE